MEGKDLNYKCKCIDAVKLRYLLRQCEITEEFARLRFKNFDLEGLHEVIKIADDTAKEYAKSYFNIKGLRFNSIALLGQVGSGKTHLLSAVSNNLLNKGERVLYFPFAEGLNDLKSDLNNADFKIRKMQKVDVLFIDDLFKGKEKLTPFEIETVFAIINYRYVHHKPLLITSEKTIYDFIKYDEAIGSRIYEMCHDFIVHIEGDPKGLNYRLRGLL
jgi:DNA replication protein DnaC